MSEEKEIVIDRDKYYIQHIVFDYGLFKKSDNLPIPICYGTLEKCERELKYLEETK